MGSAVLTEADSLTCGPDPHGGTVSPSPSDKLSVQGKFVLTQDGVNGASVARCKVTGPNTTACTKVGPLTPRPTKLRVSGGDVMLAAVVAVTDGKPPGAVTVTSTPSSRLTTE